MHDAVFARVRRAVRHARGPGVLPGLPRVPRGRPAGLATAACRGALVGRAAQGRGARRRPARGIRAGPRAVRLRRAQRPARQRRHEPATTCSCCSPRPRTCCSCDGASSTGCAMRGPALFSVYAGRRTAARCRGYLRSAAAMQSRAFPAFSYDPGAGTDLAARFSLENNPQPESDWPVERLEYADQDLQAGQRGSRVHVRRFRALRPALCRALRGRAARRLGRGHAAGGRMDGTAARRMRSPACPTCWRWTRPTCCAAWSWTNA